MNLYLVRHGLSEGNIANIHQGPDEPLSKIGLEQAKEVGKRFVEVKIDTIYCSPMLRAKQTALEIEKATGVKVKIDENLREMLSPKEIIGLNFDHPTAKKVMDEITANFHNPGYRYSDEDNFGDLKSRTQKFLDRMIVENKENVVAVSHGLALRALVGLVIFGPDFTSYEFGKLFWRLKTINTGVTKCIYSLENGWQLETWNDHSHWLED